MADPVPLTVIVPVNDAAATLGACLASIAAQARPPVAVIVVDDASTDASAAIALASGLPGLRVVKLPLNRGAGGARNAGALLATTDWLAFLDADNTWQPAFLEQVWAALVETGADFASSGGVRRRSHPRPATYRRLLDERPVARDRTADFWRIAWRHWLAVPSASVVRRAAFERAGGFPADVRTGEDITLFTRLWLDNRFCFVNQPLYTSIQTTTSLTARGPAYHDVVLMLARVGRCLGRALLRRRAGGGWFIAGYAKMVVGRHRAWLVSRLSREKPLPRERGSA